MHAITEPGEVREVKPVLVLGVGLRAPATAERPGGRTTTECPVPSVDQEPVGLGTRWLGLHPAGFNRYAGGTGAAAEPEAESPSATRRDRACAIAAGMIEAAR